MMRQFKGKAKLVRYADDFLVFFQHKSDAERFQSELFGRLAKFNLETEPSKTRLLQFGYQSYWSHARQGERPGTFNFLGFTFYMGKSRKGKPTPLLRTEKSRRHRKTKEFLQKLKELRTAGIHAMITFASQHLRGHIQYYGVSGNMRALQSHTQTVLLGLFRWLNRRSQRRSMTWEKLWKHIVSVGFPRPKIVHDLYGLRHKK